MDCLKNFTQVDSHFRSGIDNSLLVGEFKELEDVVTCPICLLILFDPICCQNCSFVMCRNCFVSSFQKSSECPNRCSQFKEGKLDRMASRMLNAIKLKCINEECLDKISYDRFINHITSCEYSKYSCNSCNQKVAKKDISQHFKSCDHICESCYICGISIKRKLLNSHVEIMHNKTINDEAGQENNINNEEIVKLKKDLDDLKFENTRLREKLKLTEFKLETTSNELMDLKAKKRK